MSAQPEQHWSQRRPTVRYISKMLAVAFGILLSGCANLPKTVVFNDRMAGTYSALAGCRTLSLDQDCSQWSGATRRIKIGGHELRVAGGEGGKVVFVMALPLLQPDESALRAGSIVVEDFFSDHGIKVLETNVQCAGDTFAGVQYKLDRDGYSLLKKLTVE